MIPLVEQIMTSHCVAGEIAPGRLATVKVDRIYIQDGNAPTVARLFREFGVTVAAAVEQWPAYLSHYRFVRFRERAADGGGMVEMSASMAAETTTASAPSALAFSKTKAENALPLAALASSTLQT